MLSKDVSMFKHIKTTTTTTKNHQKTVDQEYVRNTNHVQKTISRTIDLIHRLERSRCESDVDKANAKLNPAME